MSQDVQQLLTMDEREGADIGQMWMEAVVKELGLDDGRPGSEITCKNIDDTNVTTLWVKNQPVAIIIRQRNDWNWTATTLVRTKPILDASAISRRR